VSNSKCQIPSENMENMEISENFVFDFDLSSQSYLSTCLSTYSSSSASRVLKRLIQTSWMHLNHPNTRCWTHQETQHLVSGSCVELQHAQKLGSWFMHLRNNIVWPMFASVSGKLRIKNPLHIIVVSSKCLPNQHLSHTCICTL